MLSLRLNMLHQANAVDNERKRVNTRRNNASMRQKDISITERQFRKKYRLSTNVFKDFVSEVTPFMPAPQRSDALDVETKVLIALSFFATGSYQTPIGDNVIHPVAQASVSKAIKEVTVALNQPDIMNKHVAFPFEQSDREKIKRRFYRATRMPGVLGCVDGTHVAIIKPAIHEERFINRKGYHSLNVLIMCDADLQIMAVDASYPGSTHDSKVWEHHPLKTTIERFQDAGEDIYILGDSGYPLRKTLMTPILNVEPDTPEAHYTDLHVSARSTVERCIGVLKARFRCLLAHRTLHYAPATAAKIVNACCVLHNIAHGAGIEYTPLTARELLRERWLTRASHRVGAVTGEGAAARAARAHQLRAGRQRRNALVRTLWRQRDII